MPVAAISVILPSERFNHRLAAEIGQRLMQIARRLETLTSLVERSRGPAEPPVPV
jgi:DNA-binding IclR family transcriptional regulator